MSGNSWVHMIINGEMNNYRRSLPYSKYRWLTDQCGGNVTVGK